VPVCRHRKLFFPVLFGMLAVSTGLPSARTRCIIAAHSISPKRLSPRSDRHAGQRGAPGMMSEPGRCRRGYNGWPHTYRRAGQDRGSRSVRPCEIVNERYAVYLPVR
jgi:hypothetical protein